MIKIKDEDPVCCSYNTSTNKCWRHFLKGIKFESWKEMLDVVGASEDESANTLYPWLQSSYTPTSRHQMTNLRLSWNSHEPDVETWNPYLVIDWRRLFKGRRALEFFPSTLYLCSSAWIYLCCFLLFAVTSKWSVSDQCYLGTFYIFWAWFSVSFGYLYMF